MRIGIDFDNTIAGYDALFGVLAGELGLLDGVPPASKTLVRDALRAQPGGEQKYQRLQGQVYGRYMARAALIDGVGDFLRRCRTQGADVFIVSHKTRYGHFDEACVDLREAALAWMDGHGFFADEAFAIPRERVFFEDTRAAKIERIRALKLSHFIDDLCEVLEDPAFPPEVARLHFGAGCGGDPATLMTAFRTWPEITAYLL